MAAPLAPLSSMVAAKLISSSTTVAAKVKVGGCHQQASFFDNVNIIGNIPTIFLSQSVGTTSGGFETLRGDKTQSFITRTKAYN